MTTAPTVTFPAFRPRPPWWGGDLQTLRNFLTGAHLGRDPGAPQRLAVPADDGTGDQILALLDRPPETTDKPVIVLVHGLSGCEDSAYIRRSARYFKTLGYPVLRVNLRGAGPSRGRCAQFYYAGCSEDLHALFAGLDRDMTGNGVVLVGFSLGGNVVLKYLREAGGTGRPRVHAAASVSAPIELAQAADMIMRPRNRIYHRWLLNRTKEDCLAAEGLLSAGERQAVDDSRTLPEFDDAFTAPRNGFRDAEDYYRACSARQWLGDIAVPTLIIHARNDPWIPVSAYTAFDWSSNPHLTALLSAAGGHVGFHGLGHATAWHDRCIATFVARAVVRQTGLQ